MLGLQVSPAIPIDVRLRMMRIFYVYNAHKFVGQNDMTGSRKQLQQPLFCSSFFSSRLFFFCQFQYIIHEHGVVLGLKQKIFCCNIRQSFIHYLPFTNRDMLFSSVENRKQKKENMPAHHLNTNVQCRLRRVNHCLVFRVTYFRFVLFLSVSVDACLASDFCGKMLIYHYYLGLASNSELSEKFFAKLKWKVEQNW